MTSAKSPIGRNIIIFVGGAVALVSLFHLSTRFDVPKAKDEAPDKRGASNPAAHPFSEFNYTNLNGAKLELATLRDKVLVVNFIFTRCMGPCPLLTAKMRRLQKHYQDRNIEGKNEERLAFISISVDPDNDTPERLRDFAAKYQADLTNWYFLNGPKDSTIRLARDLMHVPADQNPDLHTTRFVVIDEKGQVRELVDSNDEVFMTKITSVIDARLARVALR